MNPQEIIIRNMLLAHILQCLQITPGNKRQLKYYSLSIENNEVIITVDGHYGSSSKLYDEENTNEFLVQIVQDLLDFSDLNK